MVNRKLLAALSQCRKIALDTNIFIYQIDADETYLPLTDPIFDWISEPESAAVTSTITMTELLVPAFKLEPGSLAGSIRIALATYVNLRWVQPGLQISILAAKLRAAYGLKTPDALQAATALHSGCDTLFTNDRQFARIRGIQVIVLDDLLRGRS